MRRWSICCAARERADRDRGGLSAREPVHAISAGLASRAPLPLGASGASPALVPTERVIERARIIKDSVEVERCAKQGGAWGRSPVRSTRSSGRGVRSGPSPPTSSP